MTQYKGRAGRGANGSRPLPAGLRPSWMQPGNQQKKGGRRLPEIYSLLPSRVAAYAYQPYSAPYANMATANTASDAANHQRYG